MPRQKRAAQPKPGPGWQKRTKTDVAAQSAVRTSSPAEALEATQTPLEIQGSSPEKTGPEAGAAQSGSGDENDEDYDENNDDDYDPLKKADVQDDDSEMSEDEAQPDYSAISTDVSQVRTRGQRYQEKAEQKNGKTHQDGLLKDSLKVDVDEIFQGLQTLSADDWVRMVRHDNGTPESHEKDEKPAAALAENTHPEAEEKIRIFTTYTFAGKLVRESKFVDANSAEAKAYLNSTNSLALQEQSAGPRKSYVPVLRKVAGSDEEKQLRIKLKRPSLIDKFLMGDKQNKLTTLEKSRLDWASFVDKKKLKDDLAIHNKGGYLEKQDFLGRVEAKRDTQYQQARELDRQRQWQQQQQQKL